MGSQTVFILNMTYYCVMAILSGDVLYLGTSESQASERLNPGTCYGVARSSLEAQNRAFSRAMMFRENGYSG